MNNYLLLFKALGEETKHKILKILLDGELCACKIPERIGRTQSNTSMQLSQLVKWGIIKARRDGKKILYTIKDDRIKPILKIAERKQNKVKK